MEAPVVELFLHKGTIVKVVKEVGKHEVEAILMFILRVIRGIIFKKSLMTHIVVQPPLLLVGEHFVGWRRRSYTLTVVRYSNAKYRQVHI